MSPILHRSETPSGAAYVSLGKGAETLLLIHGVGMRIEAWGPHLEALASDNRVVAVDLPGHGGSAPIAAEGGLKDFVAWTRQVLDDLELDEVNVAGHSMGALIATGLATEAGDRVRRVALLNGVHRRSAEARAAVIARADEIGSGSFDREAPLSRWFSDDETDSDAYRLVHDLLASVDRQGYAAAYRAFATGDTVYADAWPRVRCPALFLTGEGDGNSTPEMARAMADAAPFGQAVVIPGHRHMVNLTAVDAVNRALADWLTREVEHAA